MNRGFIGLEVVECDGVEDQEENVVKLKYIVL